MGHDQGPLDAVSRRAFLQWLGIGTGAAVATTHLPLRALGAARPGENPLAGSVDRAWEEIYRAMVGQLGTGACLEPATLYLNIVETRGESRHSH